MPHDCEASGQHNVIEKLHIIAKVASFLDDVADRHCEQWVYNDDAHNILE